MSNDMPDVIYASSISLHRAENNIICGREKCSVYEEPYYSESHVQQLIKEAEERQREKCVKIIEEYESPSWNKGSLKKAILNAGGE